MPNPFLAPSLTWTGDGLVRPVTGDGLFRPVVGGELCFSGVVTVGGLEAMVQVVGSVHVQVLSQIESVRMVVEVTVIAQVGETGDVGGGLWLTVEVEQEVEDRVDLDEEGEDVEEVGDDGEVGDDDEVGDDGKVAQGGYTVDHEVAHPNRQLDSQTVVW